MFPWQFVIQYQILWPCSRNRCNPRVSNSSLTRPQTLNLRSLPTTRTRRGADVNLCAKMHGLVLSCFIMFHGYVKSISILGEKRQGWICEKYMSVMCIFKWKNHGDHGAIVDFYTLHNSSYVLIFEVRTTLWISGWQGREWDRGEDRAAQAREGTENVW